MRPSSKNILLLTFLVSLSAQGQVLERDCPYNVQKVKEKPYGKFFKTHLKGGYTIRFGYNCEDQFLLFSRGELVIDTLSGTSFGIPYPALGYVYADFERYFVFVNRFGGGYPGNPVMVELIEKSTAKNLLPSGAALIDVWEKRPLVFYSESDVPEVGDSFVMLDLITMRKTRFPFPKNIFGEPGVCDRLKVGSVTAKKVVVEYTLNGTTRTWGYSR